MCHTIDENSRKIKSKVHTNSLQDSIMLPVLESYELNLSNGSICGKIQWLKKQRKYWYVRIERICLINVSGGVSQRSIFLYKLY